MLSNSQLRNHYHTSSFTFFISCVIALDCFPYTIANLFLLSQGLVLLPSRASHCVTSCFALLSNDCTFYLFSFRLSPPRPPAPYLRIFFSDPAVVYVPSCIFSWFESTWTLYLSFVIRLRTKVLIFPIQVFTLAVDWYHGRFGKRIAYLAYSKSS